MTEDLFSSLPATVFRDVLCPFWNQSDLFAIRATYKKTYEMLHEETDADDFWKRRLETDVGIVGEDGWKQTLRVENEGLEKNEQSLSIFGADLDDPTVVCSSPFQSWKTWCKVKRRFFLGRRSVNEDRADQNESNHKERILEADRKQPFEASSFLRGATIWKRIVQWCQSPQLSGSNGQRILENLYPGWCENDWCNFNLGDYPYLHATKAFFSFCGGQSQRSERATRGGAFESLDGLIGGYQAYDYCSCAGLIRVITNDHDQMYGQSINGVVVSDCYLSYATSGARRKLYVESSTGHLKFMGGQNNDVTFCVAKTPSPEDILNWMDYHTKRMVNGEIGISAMDFDQTMRALTLFPRFPTRSTPIVTEGIQPVSRAVVRGVEIIASAVYVPQAQHRIGYIYSIRIRLLTPQDGSEYQSPEQRGFERCQLATRNWNITNNATGHTSNVAGRGVIGMFPLLYEGGYVNNRGQSSPGTFQYQSCSGPMDNGGSFSGFIEFVPGNIRQPAGVPFRAEVRPFELDNRPELVY